MSAQRILKIRDLNPHLCCGLCQGYIVNAATVIECLHSFCRSCIYKYIVEENNNDCPTCKVLLHESYPLNYIRLDPTMNDIILKLVPGLRENELEREQTYNDVHGIVTEGRQEMADAFAGAGAQLLAAAQLPQQGPISRGAPSTQDDLTAAPRDSHSLNGFVAAGRHRSTHHMLNGLSSVGNSLDFSCDVALCLENISNSVGQSINLPAKFVCLSRKASINILKKLVQKKLSLPPSFSVDILFEGELLGKDHTLEFLLRTRWRTLQDGEFIKLKYKLSQTGPL